jgi:hypothetical protein
MIIVAMLLFGGTHGNPGGSENSKKKIMGFKATYVKANLKKFQKINKLGPAPTPISHPHSPIQTTNDKNR